MSSDTTPAHDPLSPSLRTLLALFDDELAEVRFPDVDRDVLHALAGVVESKQVEVERAEAALAAARGELEAERERLLARAQRALAYARIFAADDPALLGRLGELVLTGPAPAAVAPAGEAPKKRGRPRKQDTSLFATDEAAPAELAAAE